MALSLKHIEDNSAPFTQAEEANIKPKAKRTRAKRKTPAKTTTRRRAPPKKAQEEKKGYDIEYTDEQKKKYYAGKVAQILETIENLDTFLKSGKLENAQWKSLKGLKDEQVQRLSYFIGKSNSLN